MPPAVLDQVGDRDHAQAVPLAVRDEVGNAGHRPVLVHDLAHHAGGLEAREPGEVDGSLGLAGAHEDAAVARAEREDVAGLDEVVRPSSVDRSRPRSCARGRPPRCRSSRLRGLRPSSVNAVPRRASLRCVICGRPSSSQRSPVRQRQMRPRACVAMKLTASAVANCAATTRSPSFSRSGSSTTTTIFPLPDVLDRLLDRRERRDGRAHRHPRRHEPLDDLAEHVDLEIELVAGLRARRASSPRACAG